MLMAKSPKAKDFIKDLENSGLANKEFNEMASKLNKYDFNGALQLPDTISK